MVITTDTCLRFPMHLGVCWRKRRSASHCPTPPGRWRPTPSRPRPETIVIERGESMSPPESTTTIAIMSVYSLTFFSLSTESSSSSRFCSSLYLTLFRWLALSSAACGWICKCLHGQNNQSLERGFTCRSSSVFCLESASCLFSFCNLATRSSW